MCVEPDERITWGFLAREQDVQRLQLPLNDVVVHFPSRKILYYKYRARVLKMTQEVGEHTDHPAYQTLRSLGLEDKGYYFRTSIMPADWQKTPGFQYGYYAIPICDG